MYDVAARRAYPQRRTATTSSLVGLPAQSSRLQSPATYSSIVRNRPLNQGPETPLFLNIEDEAVDDDSVPVRDGEPSPVDGDYTEDMLTSDAGLLGWNGGLAPGSETALPLPISRSLEQTMGSDIRDSHQSASTTGFPDIHSTVTAILQLRLPSASQIWNLVDYHEEYLLWYHGCYHGPTFRQELKTALSDGQDVLQIDGLNLQWVATLFSIMAGSMACATDRTIVTWGFWKDEILDLSKQWYKAAVTCLNISDYTSKHHIFAVHAITTLSMSAHTLGFSEDISVLLGAALKIARSLGLDRLKYVSSLDDIDENSPTNQRHRTLKREIGRRLWSQLCVQDWFALPFAESQCISLTDFTTTKPSNRNHITMIPLPAAFPTYISYGNFVYDIAKLIAEHHVATAHSSTPFTKYEKVLEYDAQMRNLARKGMPKYFHATAPIEAEWPDFVPWARRSLTICFAHKIMMIHRAFIRQSFSNPAFQVTRVTCIAAAKTILKEAKQELAEDGPIIWIDQAFCIAAGIMLSLDVLHRDRQDPDFDLHARLVEDCIKMLQRFETSVIATRGAKVLSTLLPECNQMAQPYSASRRRFTSGTSPAEDTLSRQRRLVELSSTLKSLTGNVHDGQYQADSSLVVDASNEGIEEDSAFVYKQFAELFPPQAGFSNNFLFGDLLYFG